MNGAHLSRCFLYKFPDALIISVLEWRETSLRRRLRSDVVPEIVHAKVTPSSSNGFRDAGVSREFGEAV